MLSAVSWSDLATLCLALVAGGVLTGLIAACWASAAAASWCRFSIRSSPSWGWTRMFACNCAWAPRWPSSFHRHRLLPGPWQDRRGAAGGGEAMAHPRHRRHHHRQRHRRLGAGMGPAGRIRADRRHSGPQEPGGTQRLAPGRNPSRCARHGRLRLLHRLASALVGVSGGGIATNILLLYGVPIHAAVATSAGIGVFIPIPASSAMRWPAGRTSARCHPSRSDMYRCSASR